MSHKMEFQVKLFSLTLCLVLCANRSNSDILYNVTEMAEVSYGQHIGSHTARSILECFMTCSKLGTCRSMTYSMTSRNCSLNSENAADGLLSPSLISPSSDVVKYVTKGCATNMGAPCSTMTDCLDDISTCYGGTCRCFGGFRYDPDSCACTTGCTQYADTYQAMNNMYVVNSNRLEFTGVSPTWCLNKCNTYTGFVCRIAEYFSASTTCQIQAKDMSEVDGALHSTTATTYLRECVNN